MTRRQPTRRRGSVYLVVLGAAMVVGTIALATAGIGRMTLRGAVEEHDRRQAQLAARAGAEYALNWLNRNADWRTELTSGVEAEDLTSAGLAFAWTVTDRDGNLSDDSRDFAVVRVVGRSGDARSALEVTVEPAGDGAYTCLESAIHAEGDITVSANAKILRDAELTSAAAGSDFEANPARGVPDPDHVFSYYVGRGTEIPITSLPVYGGVRQFTSRVLSRNLNPFGDANPWGIYWIDCQGADVELEYSRVYGTLVLLNAGSGTSIDDVAIYQPEAPNYPSLMVDGDLSIDLYNSYYGWGSKEYLIESLFYKNYNPVGAPYDGVSDYDNSDVYPATLDGIVYVTGALTVTDNAVIRGTLVADDVVVEAYETLTVEHRPYAANHAPPGFSAGAGVRVVPGTWRQVGL